MPSKPKGTKNSLLLHDRCTSEILNEIRLGRLRPGQRLSEAATAKKLKVGRAAARVAFDRLAWAKLLERIPRSGTYVREISFSDYNKVMELRASLEGLAASQACTRISEEGIMQLDRVAKRLDKLETAVDQREERLPRSLDRDYRELQELENRFHRGIIRASGNQYILEILDNYHLVERSFLIGMSFPEGDASRVCEVPRHHDIVTALRQRLPAVAEQAVRHHYRLLKENMLLRFGRDAFGEGNIVRHKSARSEIK
jgi:DNA-binding GntR family transcriptional regulator